MAVERKSPRVRLCAPWTLMPRGIEAIGGDETRAACTVHPRLESALEGADVVMMLRVQNERTGGEAPRFPNTREYSRQYGLSQKIKAFAAPGTNITIAFLPDSTTGTCAGEPVAVTVTGHYERP